MKLLELYAQSCGLKIDKQFLLESFYPIPFEKYITIQAGSGMAGKNYPYYNEVVNLIKNKLSEAGIEIVQIGGKDDPQILGVKSFLGKTDISQSNYIIKRSLLHFGNDSWLAHRAGELGIPLVVSYATTTPQNHGPYKYNKDKTILIESHRFGRKASFQAQENPSTISLIPPEQIANSILKLLDLAGIERESLFVGTNYNESVVELVPNSVLAPQVQIGGAALVRMDYEFNEQNLFQNLQIRKCAIVTNKEINLGILAQLKGNVPLMRVEIDNISPDWIKSLKRTGIPVQFYSLEKDDKKVREMRLKYFEVCFFDTFIYPTREDFYKVSNTYLNIKTDIKVDTSNLRFKSNKIILSNGKMYLSYAHLLVENNFTDLQNPVGEVIDNENFWKEQNYFYIFK